MRIPANPTTGLRQYLKTEFWIEAAAAAMMAMGVQGFTAPNFIVGGGLSGIASVLFNVFGWPIGVVTFSLNLPLLLIGLFFSNALVAVAGALVAQSNGVADVGMGVGTIVIGLASVIIGEVLFGTRSFKNSLISVILGSIVYRLVIAIVLQMGMPPNDLKLFTAVLVAIALSLPMVKGKFQSRKAGI